MNILLINNNPVVSRLISLCMREKEIHLEEVERIEEVVRDKYDIVFVNESSYGNNTEEVLVSLLASKRVLLSDHSYASNETDFFDVEIPKPFLPSQITAVLENFKESESLEPSVKSSFIFPLSSEENSERKDADVNADTRVKEDQAVDFHIDESEDKEDEAIDLSIFESIEEDEEPVTTVLDSNEIEKIKALLEMEDDPEDELEDGSSEAYEDRKIEVIKEHLIADGLEIVDEDEYVESLSKKLKKSKKKKKKKKKKEEIFTFEEALLAAVEGMKVKKIKKLLKGTQVSIKIDFKDKK